MTTNTLSWKKRTIIATLIGNVLEHYDRSLYHLIAPFIAPLFYPNCHPITALILAYLPISILFRPAGALFFGYFGDRFGRGKALYLSMIGMSLTIIAVGCAPVYSSIGIASAFILHFLRGMICFFAAGEGTGAALSLIEECKKEHRDIMSSLYETSSILGVLIPSCLITMLCMKDHIADYWRWFFIISGIVGLFGFWMRRELFLLNHEPRPLKISPLSIRKNIVPFLAIICVTGFIVANYHIVTALMNGYIPLISSLPSEKMMQHQSLLIFYDFLMLPVFGYLSKKIGKEKIIITSLTMAALFALPLFSLINHISFFNILFMRLILVTWGIAMSAPYEYWMIELVAPQERFRVIALAKAIGSQAIGAPAISISLWIFQKTGYRGSPALYISLSAFLALSMLYVLYRKKKESKETVANPLLA